MPSNYPTGLDTFTTGTLTGVVAGADHGNKADALNKIEAELGVSPSSGQATVKARLDSWGVNVKDHAATGDGTTDDTAAIAAAITAAAEGSTVFFPPGLYKFSNLVITKRLTLKGAGWDCDINDPFGSASYATASNYDGTVLKSTATSGQAIYFQHDPGPSGVEDLMILGPGSGTSIGLRLGQSSASLKHIINAVFKHVRIDNFAKGWALEFCLDSTFIKCLARGCKTGFSINDASNQNAFLDTQVQFSDTDGIVIGDTSASDQNVFYGGLVQNISGTAAYRIVAGDSNHVDGFYWEGVTATHTFNIDGGTGATISNSRFSDNVADMRVDAPQTTLRQLRFLGTPTITITGVWNTLLEHVGEAATIVDGGFNSLQLLPLVNGDVIRVKGGPVTIAPYTPGGDPVAYLQMTENGSDAAAGAANTVRLYAKDNGSGKTQIVARFATGAVQVLATEP